ncbi:hypothetical protein C2845_PM03G03130 [Panicum miliaceum]|uniref:Uncharacterized protein n=1 Tax=Panicum miliaceum TaxID=4540 RepID=A0A3L6TEB2_PANMI|nr:hypothetical protein C2845_PM03G03130 [Panicum miliaceum]
MEGCCFDLFSQEPLSAGSNVWPSQPSATGPAHAPAPRAGLHSLDLNSQMPQGEEFPHLHDYDTYLRATARKELAAAGALVSFPLAHRALWECRTNVQEEGPAGWLGVQHCTPTNLTSALRRRWQAAAVDTTTPCRRGLPTAEATTASSSAGRHREQAAAAVAVGAPTLPRGHRATVGSAPTRPTVAAPADVGAVVGVQRGVPALRKQAAATTSTLMKKVHGRRGWRT